MAGGWLPLLDPPEELSSQLPSMFSQTLTRQWQATAFSGYWLAAAGTSCSTNSVRNTPTHSALTGGCVSPYSDGVVCRDSAVYQPFLQFLAKGFALPPSPSILWEDPQHNYVHTTTAGGLGSAALFCGNTPANVSQLFDPPAAPRGLLINKIVETLNGH
jgi:hypothetical protein